MKYITCITLLLSCSFTSFSQANNEDSIQIYQNELAKINRAYMDSMRNDERAKYLRNRIYELRQNEDEYSAFSMWFQFLSVDYSKWNADNAANGFPEMVGPQAGVGFGFSSKAKRLLFDINFATIGIKQKVEKGSESIRINYSSMFQFNWGYDLIRSKGINIYPYAGLGLRTVYVKYRANPQFNSNPNPNGISGIVLNNRSAEDEMISLGWQAGLGFEFVASKGGDNGPGTIIFFKAGTDRSFANKSFDFYGYNYNPQLKHGKWSVTCGVKFFGR